MELPKFILGNNTEYPESIFIIHTEFPRFIIDLKTDEIEWMEAFERNEEEELLEETEKLVKAASDFYDQEIERYNAD